MLPDPADVTQPFSHLVAPSIARTVKFFQAISQGALIVTEAWVHACIAAGSRVGA